MAETTMKQDFVTFYSPDTFLAETTVKEVVSWDADVALAMMSKILERYGAKPYGFRFTTRERGPDDLDSSVVATGPMHYVGGKVETREEVEARNDPKEDVLRFNMRANDYRRIWISTQGWRWTQPLEDSDIVHLEPCASRLLDGVTHDGMPL